MKSLDGSTEDARPAPAPPQREWAIGVFTGASPFCLTAPAGVRNPILSHQDVTDVDARFVADPFMVRADDTWHLFFEVKNRETLRGEIGLATSDDGLRWEYQQIVLREPFHLSYPYVFQWDDACYMIPETLEPGAIQLYQASAFPLGWRPVAQLVEGRYADPSVIHHDGLWWLFACPTPFEHHTLDVFYAPDLRGPWRPHPGNPIVQDDPRTARPAGRMLVLEDQVIRFAQDCVPIYGRQVQAFAVSELTPTSYREQEVAPGPVLQPAGDGWNGERMHHLDAHQMPDGTWIACVDGR